MKGSKQKLSQENRVELIKKKHQKISSFQKTFIIKFPQKSFFVFIEKKKILYM